MTRRQLHRILAPMSALFLIWLLFSGLLLNHSAQLKLDTRPVPDPLLFLLEASSPAQTKHWRLEGAVLSEIEGQLYWQDRALGHFTPRQITPSPFGWILLGENAIRLLDPDGLEIATLSTPVSHTTLISTHPIQIQGKNGECWSVNEALTGWQPCQQPPMTIQAIPAQPGATSEALAQWKKQHHLTWETLIHKLHSGQVLGEIGMWLWDALAIILTLMIFSGLGMRLQAKRPRAKGS